MFLDQKRKRLLNTWFVKNQIGETSPIALFVLVIIVILMSFVLKGYADPESLHNRHYALVREAAAAATLQTIVDGHGNPCIDPAASKRVFTEYLLLNFSAYTKDVKWWDFYQKSGDAYYVYNPPECSSLITFNSANKIMQTPAHHYIDGLNAMHYIEEKSIVATIRVMYRDNHYMDYSVIQSVKSR